MKKGVLRPLFVTKSPNVSTCDRTMNSTKSCLYLSMRRRRLSHSRFSVVTRYTRLTTSVGEAHNWCMTREPRPTLSKLLVLLAGVGAVVLWGCSAALQPPIDGVGGGGVGGANVGAAG